MNKAVIVRPEGLADNEDLHQVVCACGYEGRPSSDRAALISERNMHSCPKATRPRPKVKSKARASVKRIRR